MPAAMPNFMGSNQRASNVVYGCTALVGSNKAGVLKPSTDGYYTIVVGALGVYNSVGQYYIFNEEVKRLFDQSSSLQRRIADGALRSEYGHPRMQPGMKPSEFLMRILDIYEPNVCAHIRKIVLDFNNVQDKNGQKVVAIIAEVKPTGPMGPALKQSLENPSENVCFSIRSLTDDRPLGGVVQKTLKTIVTWDYVNEPGISVAKKWHAPGLEGLEEQRVTPAQLRLVVDNTRGHNRGLESTHQLAVDLAHELGWDHEDPKSPIIVPRELNW